jgi:type IX secretion system PorP/SprF family membrane protein
MMQKSIIFSLAFLCGYAAWGQQDAQTSMYFFNPLQFNPGYAGSRGTFNVTGVTRAQWVGWDGAPNTQFLSFHGPVLRQNIGLGGNIAYDKIGSRSALNAMANFAYHMRLNEDNLRLSLGLSGGIQQYGYDFTGLIVNDPTDANYLNSFRETKANFGFGAYLYDKNFYAGLSIPRLIKRSIDNNTGNSYLQRHIYVTGGYVASLSSTFQLKPSVLVKYTGSGPIIADLNLSAHLFNRFWIGGLYRTTDCAGVNFAYQIKEWCMAGYSFDFPLNGKFLNQWGTHEIVISFDLRGKNNAIQSPRYF